MVKYAPADQLGRKPYVVTRGGWGQNAEAIGWGVTASDAKYEAFGRMGTGYYVVGTRRATPEDVDRLQ